MNQNSDFKFFNIFFPSSSNLPAQTLASYLQKPIAPQNKRKRVRSIYGGNIIHLFKMFFDYFQAVQFLKEIRNPKIRNY